LAFAGVKSRFVPPKAPDMVQHGNAGTTEYSFALDGSAVVG
jgi:hypothetical protein